MMATLLRSCVSGLERLCSTSSTSKRAANAITIGLSAAGLSYFTMDVLLGQQVADWYKDNESAWLEERVEDLIYDELDVFTRERKPEGMSKLGQFNVRPIDPFMNYQFFPVKGVEVRRIGSPRLIMSSFVGIPQALSLQSVDANWAHKYVCTMQPDNHLSNDAELLNRLASTFNISDNAKRFWIQRELHNIWAVDWPLTFSSTLCVCGIVFNIIYIRCVKILDKLKVALPLRALVLVYLLTLLSIVVMFILVTSKRYAEKRANRGALALGDDYVKGAKEFYAKCSERNRLLRNLTAEKGECSFEANGDVIKKWYQFPSMKNSELLELANNFEPIDEDKKKFELLL